MVDWVRRQYAASERATAVECWLRFERRLGREVTGDRCVWQRALRTG